MELRKHDVALGFLRGRLSGGEEDSGVLLESSMAFAVEDDAVKLSIAVWYIEAVVKLNVRRS